jgi:hypothetical protein
VEDEQESSSEELVWDRINDAFARMNHKQRRVWEIVKTLPEKWHHAREDIILGYKRGSYVVAIVGRMVVWYDEIEAGFRLSLWTKYGIVDGDYWSAEASLEYHLDGIAMYFDPSLSGPPCEYVRHF